MKIALVIQNGDRRNGGAEQYTLDLAKALAGRGHQVTVVAEFGPAAMAEGATAAGFQVVYLGAKGRGRWGRLKDFHHRVNDLYEGGSYEVVHAMLPVWRCDVYQPHAGLATELLLEGHRKHPGAVAQGFSYLANQLNPKRAGLARIEQAMMAHRPYLLCFSTAMREFARERFGLPPDHLVMVINGIDLARFEPAAVAQSRRAIREEWRIGNEQALGLLVGNNWKLKGVGEAIEALAAAGDRRLALMVVGRDEPGPYRKLAEKLGVGERVVFTGSVTDPRPLYGAADFLLLPSRRDTCSLVVLEALAMGLPVITTRQNGASEVIEQGRQGWIVERGDSGALAEGLKKMLDAAVREGMARAALALRGELSYEAHVDRVEGVYRRLVAARQGKALVGG